MEIKTLVLPITFLPPEMDKLHGYGNGYIGVPREHPWFGKHYDDIELPRSIHGGLTFSEASAPNGNGVDRVDDGYWWIGFDTCHFEDNPIDCDKAYCESQVELLKQMALEAIV